MQWEFRPMLFSICTFISLVTIQTSRAQDTSFEFWPETDIWYKLSPSWRLSAFIPITKYNESKYRDLNIYVQADYAWGKTKHLFIRRLVDENRMKVMKAWLARVGVMEGWSLGENVGNYRETMLFTELHRRMPFKGGLLISHRIRPEARWLGQNPQFSYRIRYRLMFEREFSSVGHSIVPYINAEPYWDSRYATFNRLRVVAGSTFSWGPRFAYEGNITYQYDEYLATKNVFALNLILHIFFETNRYKTNI